nr:biotin transporter BioY [Halobacillus amylolyticus]
MIFFFLSYKGYAATGAIGIPVFAGFSVCPQILAGPTGGYIIGFIAAAFFTGIILEKRASPYVWQ